MVSVNTWLVENAYEWEKKIEISTFQETVKLIEVSQVSSAAVERGFHSSLLFEEL